MLVLLLAFPALRAEDKAQDKDKSPTPKEQYDALVKEYSEAQQAYFDAIRAAKTDEERQKASAEKAPKPEKFAPRFLEIAEKNPTDPIAVDALIWIATNSRNSPTKADSDKAFDLLLHNYIESEKLGPLCQILGFMNDKRDEAFLRAVLAKNPHKSVKAEASLGIGQFLQQRARLVKRLADEPNATKQFEGIWGKDKVAELKKTDLAKLEAESETVFRQFLEQYAAEMKPERLAQVCQRLSFSPTKSGQFLLRTLLEKDARRDVQGVACLALGQSLKQQADADAEKDPKTAAKLQTECVAFLERAEKEFADVKMGFGGTVGEKAKRELYEIRYLAIGMPAPDVPGEDQDGKKFKLSDHKGKVVLLDFWSEF